MADDELDPFHQHQQERSQRLYRPMEVLNEENTWELGQHTRAAPGSQSRTRPTLKPRRPHNLRNKYQRSEYLRQNQKHERVAYKREYISAVQEHQDTQATYAAQANDHTPHIDQLIAEYADNRLDDDPTDDANDDVSFVDLPEEEDDDVWGELDDAEVIYLLERLRVLEAQLAPANQGRLAGSGGTRGAGTQNRSHH